MIKLKVDTNFDSISIDFVLQTVRNSKVVFDDGLKHVVHTDTFPFKGNVSVIIPLFRCKDKER